MWPLTHERKPSEHLLLGEFAGALQNRPHAVCEMDIVRHDYSSSSAVRRRDSRRYCGRRSPGRVHEADADIYLTKAGDEISRDVEQRIWEIVETRQATRVEYVEELRKGKHLEGDWHNPAGLLTDFAKKFHRKKAGSAPTVEIPRQGTETKRCADCNGTGYKYYDNDPAARLYCACNLGQELQRMDARRQAAKAAEEKPNA
jgi:hypothetical protein